MTVRVRIRPDNGTTIAEDKDQARDVRRQQVMPALEARESIVLDFEGVEVATQSYIHALISEGVRRYGTDALDLIEFRHCSPAVQQIISTVVAYTLLAAEQAKQG